MVWSSVLLGASVAGYLLPTSLPAGHGCACRAGDVQMAGTAALAKKSAILEEVKGHLDEASLIFCVRSEGIQVNDLNDFRQKLPEGVTMRCVKNTLVQRAVEDYPDFNAEELPSLLHFSNYWFFVPEDQMKPAIEGWNDFIKDIKKPDKEIVGGVFGGEVLDGKGIEAVSKLPTKQELMGQTAFAIKSVTAKMGRSLKLAGAQRIAKGLEEARGQKMVRAFKAASEKLE